MWDDIRLSSSALNAPIAPNDFSHAPGGCFDQIRRGHISREESVAFVHTGGLPALFVHSEELTSKG